MKKIYRMLLTAVVLHLVGWNAVSANMGMDYHNTSSSIPFLTTILESTPLDVLQINQQVRIGNYQMQITGLQKMNGDNASGKGRIYLPFLADSLDVQFDHISVNILGELISGEVYAVVADNNRPTYYTPESKVLEYLQLTEKANSLPLLLNPILEDRGMDFGGHELILTNLTFTKESTFYDALFMVHNPDGHVNTFSRNNITLTEGHFSLCDLQLPMDGGDLPYNDPEFPFTIKGFNPGQTGIEEGTYVELGCSGLVGFQLVGEYRFDKEKLVPEPVQGTTTPEFVVASFSTGITTWGQFMIEVSFNSPFQIVGVDDVIITMTKGLLDYDDSQSPDLPNNYLGNNTNNNTGDAWRGFYIDTISIQLPSSISLGTNGDRITFQANDLVYDHANGLTVNVGLSPSLPDTTIAEGNLSGWGVSVKEVLLEVLHSSPIKFELNGDVRLPIVREPISYAAQFNFPGQGSNTNTTPASLNFLMSVENQTFTVPLLNDAGMVLENSTAGFEYTSGKFTPYVNLNGDFDLDFTSSDKVAGDFKFPSLGFQGFTLNFNSILKSIIPDPNNTGGCANMDFYAFDFAGTTFETGQAGSSEAIGSETDNTPSKQKVKGFPIGVKNIAFTQEGDNKKLDFTIALNFTKPKVGLVASASLSIVSQLNMANWSLYEPWNVLEFKKLELTEILIGTKQKPVNIGGLSLYGGLLSINKDPNYGEGFKGFLVMSVVPGITVDVVGQFGTIPKTDGSLDYRYWFADAKMTIKKGIKLGPAPAAIYGFGGGAYYNMEQIKDYSTEPPMDVSVDVGSQPIPAPGVSPQISGSLLTPGQGLFCTYIPKNNLFGVKAVVVLGTHPKSNVANMDLILGVEFNTDPFGLAAVSLTGDVFMMAPINKRKQAKIKGTTRIVYNHTDKKLTINGEATVQLQKRVITGGGTFGMYFNLNDGESEDWYMAIGAPPISKRMQLKLRLGFKTESINGYFVAGNINSLPEDKKTLPRLRDYHPRLQQFEGQTSLDFNQLTNGSSILMGTTYGYEVNSDFGPLRAEIGFIIGFDAMLNECNCIGYNPTGVDGWYLQGQIYGVLEGKLSIRVRLPFHKGRYNIASIDAAALVNAKLPDPTWMSAHVNGRYRILKGLVKGKFNLDAKFGEKCDETGTNLNAEDLAANIKIIGATSPAGNNEGGIPVYRQKLVVVSFLENVNAIMDFSEESDDGLMLQPYLKSIAITGPEVVQGHWRYLNAANSNVGPNSIYDHIEFISTKLLKPLANYTFSIKIGWRKKTKGKDWKIVQRTDENGNELGVLEEVASIKFTTDDRPSVLPPEAVLASYPEYKAINYCIHENPNGGGVALKQEGWGYLFNPKKRDQNQEDGLCSERILEYNYVVRIVEVLTDQPVFEEPLRAVPVPDWGQEVGDPKYEFQRPCQSENPLLNWIYSYFNIPCEVLTQGPCKVLQPTKATAKSNVKDMLNSWDFGGHENNFDLAISQNARSQDKAIGFPDFSQALEKGKIYRFELVGQPIVSEDTYTIDTLPTEEQVKITEYGIDTISYKQQSIQGDFGGGAPEKILYASTFGTSEYSTFIEKLGNAKPELTNQDIWIVTPGSDTLFSYRDFRLGFNFRYGKKSISYYNDRFPINTVEDARLYSNLIRNFSVEPNTMQYSLSGIAEGFDVYELGRFAYFANYDWNAGFAKYNESIASNDYDPWNTYDTNPKSGTNPFDSSILPKGPYAFINTGSNVNGLLTDDQTIKNNSSTLHLRFYPRTSVIYQILKAWINYDFITSVYRVFIFFDAREFLNDLYTYNQLPASYGSLFSLKYSKGGINAKLDFNKAGVSNSSFVDLSGGPFYIRNVASGRYISFGSYPNATTIDLDANAPRARPHKLTRNPDGTYMLQPSYDPGYYIGSAADNIKFLTSQIKVNLEQQRDGSIKIILPDGRLAYEHSENKYLKAGSSSDNFYDYERFTLETEFKGPPLDLNKTFQILCVGSDNYVYDGTTNTGKAVSVKATDMGTNNQFKFRRRAGGNYDITTTDGNRIHAERSNDQWIYTSKAASNIDERYFLFSLEKQSENTYYLKNKASGEYLYENKDVSLVGQLGHLLGSPQRPDNDFYKFVLVEDSPDRSAEYLIRTQSSGRHFYIEPSAEGQLITTASINNDGLRFIFEKQKDGSYKIKSKINGKYLHDNPIGPYSTKSNSSLDPLYYKFDMINISGNVYRLKCRANGEFLYEWFDHDLGATHQKIYSYADPNVTFNGYKMNLEEDSYLIFEKTYQPPPSNISGKYFIRAKNSGLYMYNTSVLFTGAEPTVSRRPYVTFVLKRKSDGSFEIWNKQTKQRVHNKTDGNYSTVSDPNLAKGFYQFFFEKKSNGYYTIKCKGNNQYLYEFFDAVGSQHLYIKSATAIRSDDASYFKLATSYTTPPADLSGRYRIKLPNVTYKYWYEGRTNAHIRCGSSNFDTFILRPKLDGAYYEIWNTYSNKRVYHFTISSGTYLDKLSNPNGLYKSIHSASLSNDAYYFKFERNYDGTYAIKNKLRNRYIVRELKKSGGENRRFLTDSATKGTSGYFQLEER